MTTYPLRLLLISQQYTIYTSSIITIIGFIGNLLNILVFSKLKIFKNNQCIFYLTVESITNIGLLIFNFILHLLIFLYGSDLSEYSSIWCKLRTMIGQTFLLLALSTLCFASVDQFFSTNSCLYLRQISTYNLARRLIIISLCFSLGHSIVFGSFYNIKPSVDCVAIYPILLHYYSYFFYPILTGFLPILISSLFSLLAYRNIRRIIQRQIPVLRRRLDRQLTKFVLIRVLFLFIFHLPVVIYRIYTIKTRDSRRIAIEKLISAIINSFSILNDAISFYIFLAVSSRYRRQVKCVLYRKYWKQWTRRFYLNRIQVQLSNALPISRIELE